MCNKQIGWLTAWLTGLLCITNLYAAESDLPIKKRPAAHKLILCNDGGTLMPPDMEAPIGIEGFIQATIDPLRDTMVDTLFWQIGTDPYMASPTHRLSEWFSHKTKVGTQWGDTFVDKKFKTAGEWRIYENTRQMIELGTDPVAVVIDAGHKADMDVFISLRFNDQHDSNLRAGLNDRYMYPLKKEHPNWLINEPGYGNTFQFNFMVPEVREYRLALLKETIENYDLDGLDLDFCRWPKLFKKGEEAAGTQYITDLLRQVRSMLDAKSKQVGRKLYFSVRVPFSLKNNLTAGMDVPAWIKERIVDIVTIADVYGWNYRLPIEEYKALAQGTECKILTQNLCAFKEQRPRSAAILFGEKNYYSSEQFRAVAAKHWQAGADGQLIWNQHWIKDTQDYQFDRQSWKEIGSAENLAYLDKHYLVGPGGKGGNLPITLSNKPAEVKIEIADDVAEAKKLGVLKDAVLRVLVEQLTNLDEVEFTLNDVVLDRATAKKHYNYNDCWIDFDASQALQRGNNLLIVKVKNRNPHVTANLTLRSVEAIIQYHKN